MKFTSYDEALDWIHGTLRLGIKPGLSRMEKMLETLGNPEKKAKWIHVAGTNGKGSTLTFIRSVLEAEGYRIGTFTSPYIERFNERISVNNEPVSDEMIVTLANRVAPIASEIAKTDLGPPSEFEIITTMMFLYFAEYDQIDFGIIEVGLGGRLDSTNVLTPLISVITTIGLDHMEFLGNSIEEIALEKGGIIKQNVPTVSGVVQPSVIDVLQKLANKQNSTIYFYGKDFNSKKVSKNSFVFHTKNQELPNLETGLNGDHQIQNASVAIQTLFILREIGDISLTTKSIYQGLKEAFWPGRLEKIQGLPNFVLDGAHNPEGIQSLINNLQHEDNIELLISILSDKDYTSMIQSLKKLQHVQLYLTTFDFPRSLSKDDVKRISKENGINAVLDWKEFIQEKQSAKLTTTIYISGSLYFISEVRKFLLRK
ncbi:MULTISPECIES: folylpolyglutamate synthase/dihydrofolate synthase family protein [Listeria]|uniref:bifunctional folylpolyglutamate synthase/dihydrofolate synthase n=1 Tax=Listeria TaxID=1637 RepID=UPI000B596686|nr:MULTISPECIES: folylpolyglutamate synthase/dihydrofolate synthase family protein [Listeria]